MDRFEELVDRLLSFGPRLPDIFEKLQAWIDASEALIIAVIGRSAESVAAVALSPALAEKEARLLELAGRSGPRNGRILDWIKAHPQIIAVLLQLLSTL